MSLLVANGLLFGLILSLGLGLILWAGFRIAPDMWLGDYPQDIQDRYGEMSERGRQARPKIALLFFGYTVATAALSLVRLDAVAKSAPGFLQNALSIFISLMVFNLIDLLIFDWLIFVNLQPDIIVLAGTRGMDGYGDYLFHLEAFLVGILYSLLGALLLAAAAVGLEVFLG